MSYIPHIALASLSILGYLGLHRLGNADGLFPLLEKLGPTYPINFTSNQSLTDLGGVLVGFFYPTVDGSHPGLTLACYVFVGQGYALWTTIMVEAAREGNRMRAVYFTTIAGIMFQLGGGGLILPAWFLLHLLISPTTRPTRKLLTVSPKTLIATPFAVLLGSVVPTVFMSLSSPSVLSHQSRVNAILLWQAFPVWTNILQVVLAPLIPAPRHADQLTLLRYVYGPVIALSALAHITGMTLAIAPLLVPTIFSQTAGQQMSAAFFTFPPHPFSDVQITSAAEGALWFIQYDYAICSWAFLLWAFKLRAAVWREGAGAQLFRSVVTTAGKSIVLGPMAASALLIWERDLAVEQGEGSETRAERKKKA